MRGSMFQKTSQQCLSLPQAAVLKFTQSSGLCWNTMLDLNAYRLLVEFLPQDPLISPGKVVFILPYFLHSISSEGTVKVGIYFIFVGNL